MKKLFLPFAIILFLSDCKNNSKINSTIFKQVKPSYSGIKFANTLTENDSLNYLTYAYMYMGGGISVGDINNDGLNDVFFTGNAVFWFLHIGILHSTRIPFRKTTLLTKNAQKCHC